jgi:hypothetical protein
METPPSAQGLPHILDAGGPLSGVKHRYRMFLFSSIRRGSIKLPLLIETSGAL